MRPTRAALTWRIQIDNRSIRCRIGDLIGVKTNSLENEELRMALLDHLLDMDRTTAAKQSPECDAIPAIGSDDATVTNVEEIDWTREPKTEYDRALRAAFIAEIEAYGLSSEFLGPSHINSTLCGLVGYQEREAASDLASKITHWSRMKDEETANQDRDENRRFLALAHRAVAANGVPKELPANVIRLTPRAVNEP